MQLFLWERPIKSGPLIRITGHPSESPVHKFPKVTILRCGSDRVTHASFSRRGGRLSGESWQERSLSEGLTVGGRQWLDETQAAVRSLLEAEGGSGPIGLVLAPPLTLLKHLQTPRVDERKRRRIVEFSAAQCIPYPLDQVEWDCVLSSELNLAQHVLIAAVKRSVVTPLCAAIRSGGREVTTVLPAAISLLAAMRGLPPVAGDSRVVLQVGGRSATLLQVSGGNFAVRTILLAGDGTDRTTALTQLLLPEVARTLGTFQRQIGLPPPTRVLLPAGMAIPHSFSQELETILKLPVTVANLAEPLSWSEGSKRECPIAERVLAEMVGAAGLALKPRAAGINLLPTGLRASQRRRRQKPWLVATGVLTLLAPLWPLWQFRQLAETARAEGVRFEKELGMLREQAAAVQSEQHRLEELKRLKASWEDVEAGRGRWLRLLADLQERFTATEDVWLDRMKAVPQSETAPCKLELDGRMLDRDNPLTPAGPAALQRAKALLDKLSASPFVASIEEERFDGTKPGVLAFRFVLVMAGQESF
ncbi:MAG: hypothetical protein RL091_1558 [Verrucomicrobiota bacterium]